MCFSEAAKAQVSAYVTVTDASDEEDVKAEWAADEARNRFNCKPSSSKKSQCRILLILQYLVDFRGRWGSGTGIQL